MMWWSQSTAHMPKQNPPHRPRCYGPGIKSLTYRGSSLGAARNSSKRGEPEGPSGAHIMVRNLLTTCSRELIAVLENYMLPLTLQYFCVLLLVVLSAPSKNAL